MVCIKCKSGYSLTTYFRCKRTLYCKSTQVIVGNECKGQFDGQLTCRVPTGVPQLHAVQQQHQPVRGLPRRVWVGGRQVRRMSNNLQDVHNAHRLHELPAKHHLLAVDLLTSLHRPTDMQRARLTGVLCATRRRTSVGRVRRGGTSTRQPVGVPAARRTARRVPPPDAQRATQRSSPTPTAGASV